MVLRSKVKHPPLNYEVGESVLIKVPAKDARVARGGNKLKRCHSNKGTIVDVNRSRHQYLVNVEGKTKWLRVEELASTTRSQDIAKRAKQQQKPQEKEGSSTEACPIVLSKFYISSTSL